MASTEQVRAEARGWITDHWSPELTLGEWWSALAEAGWAFPTWPTGFGGRGLGPEAARAVGEELAAAGALGPPAGIGTMMGGPVVIDHGTDEQRDRWLFRLASGQESWCQFFSEPGAGSDLASVQTRAVRDGDIWIVNGQKVWTSGAVTADRGLLVARTNPDAPKHRGISYFICDVDQDGIDIRPLRQMNGAAHFNEVFFTDAVVPDENRIGDVNDGWAVSLTTLAYERQGIAGGGSAAMGGAAVPGEKAGVLDLTVAQVQRRDREASGERAATYALRSPSAIAGLATEQGRADDPLVRQRIARMHALSEASRISGMRARAAAAAGRRPGPEVSTAKLVGAELGRQARDAALGILGAHGMLMGDDSPRNGQFQQMALSVQSGSIAGGTDEIQRNIVGERVLGLPKEPQVDRDVPFRDVVSAAGRQRPPDPDA
ncbi:MAG TPA: acyl-CoA dehydrogenase family protein [Acidimicrobiales bacterium]